ncbi:GNAT family N-acetyltransferase [Clostridium oryzae]|uniref:Ribosomal RNA small subunit methyltransferase A n=1 Tax=Clostridium oryzae TaxID=1450648 RepID=A0A1V4IU81_9CLOT|nr:GNAT family N-acetyltransferase [Clostridium oryzae]OPJ63601.1 ribosomal RNA small subunit methyltransferase A [Clostridium oryzae]
MNILLKSRTREHVETYWNKTQDKELQRLFPFYTKSLEDALRLFEESLKEEATSYGKIICYDGRYIGDIWCYGIDEADEKMAMLSIVIFEKKMWGKGIGAEAAKIFIGEVFNKYSIDKIGAFTYSFNHGSIGLLEKTGFVKIDSFVEDGIESKYYEFNSIWKLNPERDKRLTFNENVKNYDKWRPTYCKELFEEIINYSNLNQNSKVIEVGIGTGQATGPFLKAGCELMAVELGESLAEYSKDKFKDYKNFSVYNTSFENFKCEDNSIDLLYSATAFHWIPEEVGYPKILKLLKENGILALFWNKPFVARENDQLHQRIQSIYQKYRYSGEKMIENDVERYRSISKKIQSYGFRDVEVKLYHQTREFSSSDYISLLNTYSDHRTMPEHIKKLFESEIENAILEYDDVIKIYDTIDLYLARK